MTNIQLPRPISRIVFRCSEQTKTVLLSKMGIHEGSMLTDEVLQHARDTAKAYSDWLAVLVQQSLREEEYLKSLPETRKTFVAADVDEGVNVVIWDRSTPPQRVRVDGTEHNSRLIEKPMPSGGCDEARGTGSVTLAIVIGRDGGILEVDALAGPDPLISPAADAVRHWRYQPTLLNGRPVEVETTVEVEFPAEK